MNLIVLVVDYTCTNIQNITSISLSRHDVCGSEDPCSIPGLPSPRGPSDGKEVKDVIVCPGACVGVGSAR